MLGFRSDKDEISGDGEIMSNKVGRSEILVQNCND
jgi:hypothetical protein